jgi:hypothetical protein
MLPERTLHSLRLIINIFLKYNLHYKKISIISDVSKRSDKLLTMSYWLHVELRKNI